MHASIIIPIQVADDHFTIFLEHLECALYAARRQTAPSEIIVVDYNSADQFVSQIKKIAKDNHAVYVQDERTDKLWSRGRALNVGIKCAVGELLLFVDTDCIIPTSYVAEHAALIDSNHFTYSEFFLTTPNIRKTGHYETLLSQSKEIKDPYATCCSHQGILQETVKKIGMFDESYRGWGFEEHDYICTLKKAGIQPKLCAAMPIHLYHDTWEELMRCAGRVEEQQLSRAYNKERYFRYAKESKK
jgi:predicted glycosyltransferase involved in capsule biosynthesis